MATPTFTFDIAAPQQMGGPAAPSPALQGSVGQGGPASVPRAQAPDMSRDTSQATLNALLGMGGQLLAPHIEGEKQRMAMEGMVAAMQGMSAAEIRDSEILGGLFGDSVTVNAARQVEQMDAINNFNISLSGQMQELRKQTPQEFRRWLPGQMKQFMTGDSATDALVTQAFVERMPQTVEMHTKSHTAYRQEEAHRVWSNDLHTMGRALQDDQAAVRKGELSPEGYTSTQASFVSRLAGPAGIAPEAYPKWLGDMYKRFAADGNLAALDQIEATGVLLTTQNDAAFKALVEARDRAENRIASRSPALTTLMRDRGQMEAALDLGTTGFQSVDQVLAWMDRANADALAVTGSTKPAFDNLTKAAFVERFIKGEQRAAERLGRLDPSDTTSAVALVLQARAQGTTAQLAGNPAVTGEVQNLADAAMAQDAEYWTPEATVKAALMDDRKYGHVEAALSPIRSFLATGAFNARTPETLQYIQTLMAAGGSTVVEKYLGKGDAEKAMMLVHLGIDFSDKDKVLQATTLINDSTLHFPTAAEAAEVKDSIVDLLGDGFFKNIFNAGPLANIEVTDRGRSAYADLLKDKVFSLSRKMPHVSTEHLVSMAHGLVANNLDFVDGVPVVSMPAAKKSQRSLHDAVNAALQAEAPGSKPLDQYSEVYQRSVRALVDKQLAAIPGAEGIFSRNAEQGQFIWDGAIMRMQYIVNGNPVWINVRPKDVIDQALVEQARAVQGSAEALRRQHLISQPAP